MPPVPNVTINKTDGNTGVPNAPNPVGILAIIAPCQSGTANVPTPMSKPASVLSTFGYGPLSELAAYVIGQTKKPVLCIKGTATTAAAYGSFTYTGSGTLSGSVTGTGSPLDDFLGGGGVEVLFTLGGTTGTGPITYQYSIDGRAHGDPGKVYSSPISLGTGLSIAIPNTGITFSLVTAKTVVAGDYFTCPITGPRMTDADVQTALTALGLSTQPWEAVVVASTDATTTTVTNCDTTLAGLEASGKYRMFIANAPMRGATSEAAYLTAETTLWASAATIRGCMCADGEILTSVIRGIDMQRPLSWAFAARLLSQGVTIDAAQVDLGPLASVRLADANGNPLYHDEQNYPGLDAIRLVTARSFNNKIGAFITNPNVLSGAGSDYVFAQHVRTMNRACELAFGELTNQLSKGVFKDVVTAKIREDSAQNIEQSVNNPIQAELGKSVVYVGFSLSRDDDLSSNAGATLTGTLTLISPAYVKGFTVNAKFAKTIAVSA